MFPIWLAQKTGALVCPMATWRNRERGALFVAEFGPCLDLADEKEPHEVGMHAMSQWLDGWLRAHPGDWHFWDQWHDGPGGLIREAP